MAGLSTAAANAILNCYFRAEAWANVLQNHTSSPMTSIYAGLHSADPGDGGNQSTSEISYPGPYARIAVVRTSSGWTSSTAGLTRPQANIVFATASTGASVTATHGSLGKDPSGAGEMHFSGPVTPNIVIVPSSIPTLLAASTGFTLT